MILDVLKIFTARFISSILVLLNIIWISSIYTLVGPIEMQNNGDGFGLENYCMCVSKTFEYEEMNCFKVFFLIPYSMFCKKI